VVATVRSAFIGSAVFAAARVVVSATIRVVCHIRLIQAAAKHGEAVHNA
jgi:hypothetical protein